MSLRFIVGAIYLAGLGSAAVLRRQDTSSSASSSAASTSTCPYTAPKTTDDPDRRYHCHTCSELQIDFNSGGTRPMVEWWNKALGDDAVYAETWAYSIESDPGNGQPSLVPGDANILQWLTASYGVKETNPNCVIGAGTCTNIACGDSQNPAISMMFNSIVNLRNYIKNQYDALGSALSDIQSDMGGFSETFAPVTKDDSVEVLKVIIDVMLLGYGQFSAFLWNKLLKDAAFFKNKGNDHGWAKDSTNSMITVGGTLAKDNLQALSETLQNNWSLAALAGNFTLSLQDTMEKYLINIQSGSKDQIDNLINVISGGYWADSAINDNGPSMADVREAANNALYTMLIPQGWKLAYNTYPGIVIQPGTCNQENPFKDVKPMPGTGQGSQNNHHWAMSDDDAKKVRFCPEGDTNTYYLIKAGVGKPSDALTGILPGYETLDGSQWGGITPNDIFTSALQGYQLNGNKNGYVIPNDQLAIDGKGTKGDFFFQNGASTPGLWKIPLCSAAAIGNTITRQRGAWQGPDQCTTFPCCAEWL